MIFCTRWVVYATHRVLLLFQKSRKGTVLRYFLFLRKVPKGFSFVCVKPLLRRAESRFAEPRFSLWEGFNFASAKPPLRRAEARFGKPRKVSKGFNFVSGKLLFGCADSRFGEPRSFLQGNGFILFACTKRTKSTPEVCEPLDSGDDSKLCRKRF